MGMTLRQRLVRRLVRASGLRLAEQIPKDKVTDLIKRLRPYHSGHKLIRLGPQGDGGYLVPDDLDGITHCFSPGVSNISGFEIDLVERDVVCFLADYSVVAPEMPREHLMFDQKYIGSYTDEKYLAMDDWVCERLPDNAGDLLLQMDIEGAEYEVFLNISDMLLRRFRILVVEFHYLTRWFERPFYSVVRAVFNKILRHFDVVHLHPNNCCQAEHVNGIEVPPLMELTFLRKDRFTVRTPRDDFPHALDRDNTPKESVVLPAAWYDQE